MPNADSGEALKPTQLGKYAILGAIGRGGMADVYLALAQGPSGVRKLVVVKCMRAGSEIDSALSQMFHDEGRLAALLNHANVVHTYEVGQGDDGSYIVMEYLHGQTLSAVQRAAKPLAPRLSARIVADALSGLHYVHELRDLDGTPLRIVHRDLSPPNIFVTHDGVVKLVDFGIAKTAIATRASTEAGIVKGKLAYMAPEQTTSGVVDRRADIYAMGVVLWELLAARRLVEDLSPVSIVRHTLHGSTPLVSSIRPEIDPALDRIVERALRREAALRYATALQMQEDLEEFLAGGPAIGAKELGQMMAEHFSTQREQRERQIQSWVAAFTPERPSTPPLVSASERAAGSESSRLIPLQDQLPPPLEEPRSRRVPVQSQPRLLRGALVAGVLAVGLTTFALLANQRRTSDRNDPAELVASSASTTRVANSNTDRLEVAEHPSLPADSVVQPSSPRATDSGPLTRPGSGRKPPPSPKPARLTEPTPPNSPPPSVPAVTAAQTAPSKVRLDSELEHNPYLHSE